MYTSYKIRSNNDNKDCLKHKITGGGTGLEWSMVGQKSGVVNREVGGFYVFVRFKNDVPFVLSDELTTELLLDTLDSLLQT
jgi:hypothetical protein